MLDMIPRSSSCPIEACGSSGVQPRRSGAPLFELAGAEGGISVAETLSTVRVPAADPAALKRSIRQSEEQVGCGPWVGALPFHGEGPSLLMRPRALLRISRGFADSAQKPIHAPLRIQGEESQRRYRAAVASALCSLAADDLEKVVLAKYSRFELEQEPSIPRLLSELRRSNPGATAYALRLDSLSSVHSRVLVGASPELLVSREGEVVRCMPLAGSRPRSQDPVEDERQQQELLASSKDHAEHALMVDSLVEDLGPWVRDLKFPRVPVARATSTMWHLATPISGRLRMRATTSLDLALALHPTAAVCGVPCQKARSLIRELEPEERGFYGGAIGMMDQNGDGKWFVAIRGAEIEGRSVRILSGAGLVRDSIVERECQETEDKMKTILRALSASTTESDAHS